MRAWEAARCARELLWLSRTQYWSANHIRRYQEAALKRIVAHAFATVPYYRNLRVPLAAFGGSKDLAKVPQLTKEHIQADEARLISDSYRAAVLHESRTSGSTGEPTTTYFDANAWLLMKHALKWRRTLCDLRYPPYRVLAIDESAPAAAGASWPLAAVRRVGTESGIETHLDVIRQFKPTGIYGTPSWLNELALAAEQAGAPLPPARVVWTSSEVLTLAVREAIERSFGCSVRDVYGSTELKDIAAECEHGRKHINFETSFVEVLSNEDGDAGPLVVTNLVNRAMPLIRFRVGDVGRLESGDCPCGRAAPWIADIHGREVDLVEVDGSRKISPYALSTLVATDGAILRFRMIQRSPREIEIQYVLRPGADVEIARLTSALRAIVDDKLEFVFTRVERITEEARTGKQRALIRSADLD